MPKNELKAKVTADTSDYNRKMRNLSSTAASAASIVVSGFALATAALVKYGVELKNLTKKSEDYRIGLIASFRDVERGNKFYEKLQKTADKSSASTDDMMQAAVRLSNNLRPDEMDKWVDSIEDMAMIASSKKININEFASTLGEISSKFDLSGKIDADMWQRLARVIGKEGVDNLRKMNVETLKSSELQEALRNELKSTAKVVKGEYEKSISGLEAKLGGMFQAALRKSGRGSEEYKELLNSLMDFLTRMEREGVFESVAGSIGSITKALSDLASEPGTIEFFKDLAKILSVIAATLTAIIKGLESFSVGLSAIQHHNAGARQGISARVLTEMRKSGKFSKEDMRFARDKILGGATGEDRQHWTSRDFIKKADLLTSGSKVTQERGVSELNRIMSEARKDIARTANTLDPQREASNK